MNKYLRKRERAKRRSITQEQKEVRRMITNKVKVVIKAFIDGDDIVRVCPPYGTTEAQSATIWDSIAKELHEKIPHFWYLWTVHTYYIAFTPIDGYKKYYPKEEIIDE